MQQDEPISKRVSLAQKPAFKLHKLRLRWLLAISSIPLFGIYAAFGTAPQTTTQNIPISTIIEEVAIPEAAESLTANQNNQNTYWQTDLVRRDDTLSSLVARLNIRNTEALEFLRRSPEASPLASQLKPGRSIRALTNDRGELIKLEYQLENNSSLLVDLTESGYKGQLTDIALETHTVLKSAEIKNSLFGATDDADIPDQIAVQIAEIFSSDIDFNSDLRRGDKLNVLYEASYNQGNLVKTGQVLAAEFINDGKTFRAVMYRNPDGQVSYYTPDGQSLHKSFLRSPLEFSRISSGFSLGRFHPILQTIRAHKGVDYAAPTGTRIKAAGDGVVDFVGIKGGYGNVIVLKHANNISTVYGHMSAFASNIHRGTRVAQGDVIGFVGMTGLATGPHLHYEFLLNGEQHDPLKVALPQSVPISPSYKADFAAHSAALTAQLNLLSARNLASLE